MDKPNTSGFLCHTCVWRERAESHELMDIPALMRHGQRYHYLQQGQMTDYLRSSYRVYRCSAKHDEYPPVLYEQLSRVTADSFELPERSAVLRSQHPGRDDIKEFGALLPVEMNEAEKVTLLTDKAAYPVNNLTASNDMEEYEAADYFGATTISPTSVIDWVYGNLEWASGSWDNCSYSAIPLSAFNESTFGSYGAFFTPEDVSDPDLDFNELGHSLSMHPVFLPAPDDILEEEMTLSGLDRDLARLPIFDTQLDEYNEWYGARRGDLGWLDAQGGELKVWEGDRLQMWPEKVVPTSGTSGRVMKDIEEADDILWLPSHDGDFGEAGEYMDMRDMECDTC